MDTLLTADIAVNSPRYRRSSSNFIDAIHDVHETADLAPAQLYSTMSGRLFHSGRIAIIMVGLPARGKTHISVSVARYLQWLGVKTRVFHLGDYRRATIPDRQLPEDYFFPEASPVTVMLRQKILKKCREDMYYWLDHENGQVAIYDAVNPSSIGRRALEKELAKHDVQTLFIESFVDDERILKDNVRDVKISMPDFAGIDPDKAATAYLDRIQAKIPVFESMHEKELNWVQMMNAGRKFVYNNVSFNYLCHRIVFFLTNLNVTAKKTFFARAGTTTDEDSYKADAELSDVGREYSKIMTETLLKHRESEQTDLHDDATGEAVARPLIVWTSTRIRTIQTAEILRQEGFKVRHKSQLSQLNPGVCEKLDEATIRERWPDEIIKHQKDPYHHRFPRAESYHDIAVRLEPIILELERTECDVLIIAHESVLRVLYAYLMHCATTDIPFLKFPKKDIIEITPRAYQNKAKRIPIPLDHTILPRTPEIPCLNCSDPRVPKQLAPISGLDLDSETNDDTCIADSCTQSSEPIQVAVKDIGTLGAGNVNDED